MGTLDLRVPGEPERCRRPGWPIGNSVASWTATDVALVLMNYAKLCPEVVNP
jgi:hypothetical protein